MGICRHPRLYKKSRAGTKLFHKNRSITSQHRDETTTTPEHNLVNNSVLIRYEGMSNMTNKPYTIKYGLVNYQSVVNKTLLIQTEVFTNKLDICALTETWIKQDDKLTTHCICPLGYKCITPP